MIGFLTRNIPRRILVALLSIYVVTYIATALVVYSSVRASILESQAVGLNQLADAKYGQLANVVSAMATNVTAWSKLDVMNDLVSGDIDKRVSHELEELKILYNLSGDIYAFNSHGKLIASSRGGLDGRTIPPQWRQHEARLIIVDKGTDPMSGGDIVAFEIPVFARFDAKLRIGTLVVTDPWSSVEALLFGQDSGTMLLEDGNPPRILAANPPDIVDRVGSDPPHADTAETNSGFVIGRSLPRSGLIANWQVMTIQDVGDATRALRKVALELALLGVCLGVPIVFFGRWLSRKLTAPIGDLTRVIGEIADTDRLDARAPVPPSEELGTLARSFNRMTDNLERATQERERVLKALAALNRTLESKIAARTGQLEAAIRSQRRLISDISHEIKSPLARLSMALGLARRAPETDRSRQFDRIEREIEFISALASELLTLARVEGDGPPPEFSELDILAVMTQITSDAAFEKPERADDINFRKPGYAVYLFGNKQLLHRAIENVVRNALFYTVPGTPVTIEVARTGKDRVAITVSDCGPGVPETALAHLFEPFYRVDEARARATGGAGIGLTICRRVIQLHGGTIRARHNQPHGLIVEIELPSGRS